MDNKELLKEGRILALKIIAESFLLSKGNEVTDNMFPKSIDKDSNELVEGDLFVLHHYLLEQYKRVGLDLNKLIEFSGEQVVPGQLSKFEIKELACRADEVIVMTSIVKKYVEAKNNKQA